MKSSSSLLRRVSRDYTPAEPDFSPVPAVPQQLCPSGQPAAAPGSGRAPANQPLPRQALREAVNPRSPDHLLKEQILQDFLERLGLYLQPLNLSLPRIRSLSGDFQNTPPWLYHLSELIFAKKAGRAGQADSTAASGVQLPFRPQLLYLGPLILRLNFRQDHFLNLGAKAGGEWLYFQLGHVLGLLLFDHNLNIEQLLALQPQTAAAKHISGKFCRELLSALFEQRTEVLAALAAHPAAGCDPYLAQLLSQAARDFSQRSDPLFIKEELDKLRGYLAARARHEQGGDCYHQAANHAALPWDLFETIECSGCRGYSRRHYLALQLLNLLLLFTLYALQCNLAALPYHCHVPLLQLAAALRDCALLQLPRCERFGVGMLRLAGPEPAGLILPKLMHRCHLKPLLDYYDLQTLMQRFDLQMLRLPAGKVQYRQ